MEALRPAVVDIIKRHQSHDGDNAEELADEVMAAVTANMKPYQYNAELIRILLGYMEAEHKVPGAVARFEAASRRQTRMSRLMVAFFTVWIVWQGVWFFLFMLR